MVTLKQFEAAYKKHRNTANKADQAMWEMTNLLRDKENLSSEDLNLMWGCLNKCSNAFSDFNRLLKPYAGKIYLRNIES